MSIIKYTCPFCGADLKNVRPGRKYIKCEYCDSELCITDEEIVKAEASEDAGYWFEKGRQRALSEQLDISSQSTDGFQEEKDDPEKDNENYDLEKIEEDNSGDTEETFVSASQFRPENYVDKKETPKKKPNVLLSLIMALILLIYIIRFIQSPTDYSNSGNSSISTSEKVEYSKPARRKDSLADIVFIIDGEFKEIDNEDTNDTSINEKNYKTEKRRLGIKFYEAEYADLDFLNDATIEKEFENAYTALKLDSPKLISKYKYKVDKSNAILLR